MLPENQMQECIAKGREFSPIGARRFQAATSIIQAADWRCKPSLCSSKRYATAVQIGNDRMWRKANVKSP
jgi:hypothetical protein